MLAAVRLARSFLLLEDDHGVDWEVDWDESASLHPQTLPRSERAPASEGHPSGPPHRRRGVSVAERRRGQQPPPVQPCLEAPPPATAASAGARRGREERTGHSRPCRLDASTSGGGPLSRRRAAHREPFPRT